MLGMWVLVCCLFQVRKGSVGYSMELPLIKDRVVEFETRTERNFDF